MSGRRSEPYVATWLHSQGRKHGLPVGGNFELTARCNFSCPMCYIHTVGKDPETAARELTAQQWIRLAEQARDRGMMFALLTGGEPFLRPDFFEIYEAMRAMGLLVSINSNGSMLHGAIRERLLENPPQRINISLYGGCGQTYRNMCGQDAFDTVTENIRALKEAGVDVRLNLSITPHNRQDLERICSIAKKLEVHVKATGYMYPPVRSGNGKNSRLSPQEAARCNVQWDQLRFTPEEFALRAAAIRSLAAPAEKECAADPDEGVGCRAGYSTFWMTWDGRMLPCGMMPGPEAYPLEVGFDAAWEQIRQMTRQIRMPKECGTCRKREVCGVCAAVCVAETGSFEQVPEYMCRMTDETLACMEQAEREGKEV